jgi:hypothetical protein
LEKGKVMNDERRAYFRVDIIESLQAVARIVSINGMQAPVQKPMGITVRDISGGGMKIESPLDLPSKAKIVVRVSFSFEEQLFNIEGVIIRKEALKDNINEYGIRFIGIPRIEENRLVRCLNQYKFKNVRAKKSQIDLRKQKGIGPLLKIIEAIEVPAYLVTSQRVVVAANRAALAQGIHLGERCYQMICQNKKVCPHCRMDEAQNADDILSTEAIITDEKYYAHWIYLEYGLTLHYLKKEA